MNMEQKGLNYYMQLNSLSLQMNKNIKRIVNFDLAIAGDNIMTELKRD